MKRTFLCLVILSLAVIPSYARRFAEGPLDLPVAPAKIAESAQHYQLVLSPDQQTNADAFPLYEKAIAALPRGRTQDKQVREWLDLPPEQLPQEQVEALIQKHMESLTLVAQAARCRQCNWPKWKPGMPVPDQKEYRSFTFLLELWARLEIVRGDYDQALLVMQTGFGMGRQLGQGPTLTQAMVGTAVGGVLCREIELFIKGEDAPNLYRALAKLPEPLADVQTAIDSERANLKNYNFLLRRQFAKQLKPAHDRTLFIAKRMDTNLNALQCVEAIRHYAATHDGRLPETLADMSDIKLPIDLMNERAFGYQRTATGAVLQADVPKGGQEHDIIRYQVILKK